jgi:hypothetical protein
MCRIHHEESQEMKDGAVSTRGLFMETWEVRHLPVWGSHSLQTAGAEGRNRDRRNQTRIISRVIFQACVTVDVVSPRSYNR